MQSMPRTLSIRALMQGPLPVTAPLVLNPLMAKMVEDAGFPAKTGADGKTYLRIRMESVSASQLGLGQRLKGLALRSLDGAGGTVVDLLKGLASGEIKPRCWTSEMALSSSAVLSQRR